MNNYFFTGFPGFLATYIVKELVLSEHPVRHVQFLVLPNEYDLAQQRLEELKSINPKVKYTIFSGDITKEQLGLSDDDYKQISEQTHYLFHLAAIYDLSVPYKPAFNVNVNGTIQINKLAVNCVELKKYIYFSTSYVSGKRSGRIFESELEHDTGFKNHYEETKYLAEKEVQRWMGELPISIIRPGIVVGHSETGETLKFDGPYYMLEMFRRIRNLPLIPYIGKGKAPINLVPVDYMIQSTLYLSHLKGRNSKVYQIADPSPSSSREIYRLFALHYLGKEPKGQIPSFIAKGSLSIPFARKMLGTQKQTVDYMDHYCVYDTTNTKSDLRGSGIEFPQISELVPTLVRYFREQTRDRESS
ncbi:3-beta hydroxysteroid dehydrogenase [Halalkalibacillus sediminis]|uniref:3-beta hydroxysteroid dehydrogenase n=1 Tax=Halalkalibacillus sediminis TaxID=2018042 RepID=A0A2I0QSE2_9BACI|nr:SDR family oxidoreductase [Halalkalibacillus sediminis]PKR77020.1 3-beta hydroxysteroid dehydrogenase [Halalkalibacillus sediminis]